ncbi:unnamed protein product [Caenorhabditis bovis]|uniref:Fatty-acid and retinol-binding protein 1 n=1 Tax=Caenorhabditis bovis TaxID=2654633 RepID=A0A8S1FE88_9PELO|nr:unnamed protein product [Caenorhabditis bovis]
MKFAGLILAIGFHFAEAAQEDRLTAETITEAIGRLANSKPYIPEYVYNVILAMDSETKTELAQLCNDYFDGKIETPKNIEELMTMLNADYSLVASTFAKINIFYRQRLGNLGPKSREFLNNVERRLFDAANNDTGKLRDNLATAIEQAQSDFRQLYDDDDEATKLDEQFPQFRNIYNSLEKIAA